MLQYVHFCVLFKCSKYFVKEQYELFFCKNCFNNSVLHGYQSYKKIVDLSGEIVSKYFNIFGYYKENKGLLYTLSLSISQGNSYLIFCCLTKICC